MRIRILAFGAAQDIVGGRQFYIVLTGKTAVVGELKTDMLSKYPKLAELVSFLIAVNSEYADDDRVINSGDEVAIIPPTSGG
jgi:molybdopterin synthase sulfur carrier subunit